MYTAEQHKNTLTGEIVRYVRTHTPYDAIEEQW